MTRFCGGIDFYCRPNRQRSVRVHLVSVRITYHRRLARLAICSISVVSGTHTYRGNHSALRAQWYVEADFAHVMAGPCHLQSGS
jgi:hypothetical protein